MKNIKKKLALGLAGVVVGFGAIVGFATPASAFSTLEMTQSCRLNNYGHHQGQAGWTAQLTYSSQGVYGWRCFYNDSPSAPTTAQKYGLSVQLLCDQIYGGTAKFTSQSNAYSWYCG